MSRRQAAKVLGVSHETVAKRELLGQSDQNDWRTPRRGPGDPSWKQDPYGLPTARKSYRRFRNTDRF
jgi:hypothetical protein